MLKINNNKEDIFTIKENDNTKINAMTFIFCMLADEQLDSLKEKWNNKGGYKKKPWWEFVFENISIIVDED